MIYWKVVFGHRNSSEVIRVFFEAPGGYRSPPGKYWALMGHSGEEEAGHKRWRAPPYPIRIGQGVGARPPSFLLPPFPSGGRKEGGGGESYGEPKWDFSHLWRA